MTDLQTNGAARPIYYWVHHTGRYDGNTGVQRVVRLLGAALAAMPGVTLVPVRWCAERESIVRAEAAWTDGLARHGGPALNEPEEAGTPLNLAKADAQKLHNSWLIIPEVTHFENAGSGAPAAALPVALDYARYHGMRTAAVFYDLIPLREPGYEALRPSHAAYALALAATDLVLAISRTAALDLAAWWREQGHDTDRLPSIRPILLPAEMIGLARVTTPGPGEGSTQLRVLAAGTVEPRKNQLALMQAVNRLRARRPDLPIRLDVVGSLHHAVAEAATREAAASGGSITLHHYAPEALLRGLLRDCDITAFISLNEGFGLPIVESLWQGKPCLCSNLGSMAEIAAGGGCLSIDPRDPAAIEAGLERLATDAAFRAELAEAACSRELTSWDDYASDVLAACDTASPVPLLAVIEGSRGGGEATAAALEAASALVWRHHWRPGSQAILPGWRDTGEPAPAIGRGHLHGLWGALPLATTAGPAEAIRIQDEAHGLGLKLAVIVEDGTPIGGDELLVLAGADLALFATDEARAAALGSAWRALPRTATLREHFGAAGDARAMLAAIAARRPRIAAAGAPHLPKRVFYWTGLTATQKFNTGVQRVTRSLGRALGELGVELIPVKWDEAAGRMAPLDRGEAGHLAQWGGPPPAKPAPLPQTLSGEWLLLPEITVPVVPTGSNVGKLARSLGMRVAAIFYDLIPVKMAEFYPPGMVSVFNLYWDLFADIDVALPISWSVAADLRRFLGERGMRLPAIVVCPLAGDLPGSPRQTVPRTAGPADAPFRLLVTGTWEPRKNYPRLLRALIAASAQAPARPIHLTIVGRRAGFADLDADISALAAQAGTVELHDHVSDAALLDLFDRSDATAFCSWEEGFGLPILESLWRGLPCLCHDGSAMAEVAPGGGVLAIDMLDETAIARAITRLATDLDLMARLRQEAVARPIRAWDEYARDVLSAMARAGTAPGWPLPAILTGGARPLLSCAITTYNRARWLTHSLPRLIDAARPFGDRVEVVVCDNTSTDATPDVVARFAGTPGFSSRRNPANLGMLGNLGATTRATTGAYVWLMGDDDLIIDGAIEAVLTGLEAHPDVEMAYMNYAYTNFDAPERLSDPNDIVRGAKSIGYGGPNRRVAELREVAALNENLFTAIYACAFRRDHALRAYQQDVSGAPFSSLLTCIPSSVYAIAALQDRPAWWVGQPAMVVNMNVSWLRWALLWHLERMPDLFDASELAGIDPVRVDRHRTKHCWNAGEWAHMALMQAEDAIRERFSVARLIERCKHIDAFKPEIPKLRAVYTEAWAAGRVAADTLEPDALFAQYGLESHEDAEGGHNRLMPGLDLEEFNAALSALAERMPESAAYQKLAEISLLHPLISRLCALDPLSGDYKAVALQIYRDLRGNERPYDPQRDEVSNMTLPADLWRGASPWSFQDATFVSEFLLSWGQIMRALSLPAGSDAKILEYGSGSGQLLLFLARLGLRTSAVDIDAASLDLLRAQACAMQLDVRTEQAAFGEGFEGETFDRIIFFEAFHHAIDFAPLLTRLRRRLNPGGLLILCGEPVVPAPAPSVPYPWGPRLDGLSVYCIRRHGWMELGFTEAFLIEALHRHGWLVDISRIPHCGRSTTYTARPYVGEAIEVGRHRDLGAHNDGWESFEDTHRWTCGGKLATFPLPDQTGPSLVTILATNPFPRDIAADLHDGKRFIRRVIVPAGQSNVEIVAGPCEGAFFGISTVGYRPADICRSSSDTRKLGLMVHSIKVDQET